MSHKSGYVNIVGRPNVGKSTLINALLHERMSIITHKPQTTRHRILGIYNDEDHQIVFSDTPGIIESPHYKMQETMNEAAFSVFDDADMVLFVTTPDDPYAGDETVLRKLRGTKAPKFLIINKVDTSNQEVLVELMDAWAKILEFDGVYLISALLKEGVEGLFETIKSSMPEGPAYYPKDQLSDRSVRFFISEIIREQILLLYRQEIPYSVEVEVDTYQEDTKHGRPLVRIHSNIYVNRKTQKNIIIGHQGKAIKQIGINSRKRIEEFLKKQVYLELFVKVKEKWRDDENFLRKFGYKNN